MRRFALVSALFASLVLIAGCSGTAQPATAPAPGPSAGRSALVDELTARHDSYRAPGLERRQFDPDHYWALLSSVLDRGGDRFRVREVGRSIENRPIRRIDFGRGDTTVMLWSQMHGNESTASRALVDVMAFLSDEPDQLLVRGIEERLSVTFVPVLNPDGAARFVRHNALGIDINRDARRLATPEARALKAVRDDVDATWGFNLHDQNVRTRLGSSGRDVLIALLAPPPGFGETSPANLAARRMCSLLAGALAPLVGDQVARYDESFNPRAFGDLMTQWGTSVVLIESGGELADPDKARLRRANFVAVLVALDAIARDAWRSVSEQRYLQLPLNSAWIYDLLVRGAAVVLPGREAVRADLAINYDDTLDRARGTIVEVGDLQDVQALDEIDGADLYFLPDPRSLSPEVGPHLRPGDAASGVLARDPRGEDVVLTLRDGKVERRP